MRIVLFPALRMAHCLVLPPAFKGPAPRQSQKHNGSEARCHRSTTAAKPMPTNVVLAPPYSLFDHGSAARHASPAMQQTLQAPVPPVNAHEAPAAQAPA